MFEFLLYFLDGQWVHVYVGILYITSDTFIQSDICHGKLILNSHRKFNFNFPISKQSAC